MKKGTGITVALILIFIAGVSLLLYPSIADSINKQHQTKAVASYVESIGELDKTDFEKIKKEAAEYNRTLLFRENEFVLTDEQRAEYEKLLYIEGSDIMGYVEIPTIDVTLPIYHGCSDDTLRAGAGHLEWTSLPVGGKNTHCVLSGHRGLPSARLFTDLDKLEIGDEFKLYVLDEVLTYEVDQILIVKPKEVDAIRIVEGEDYCTLITCTPYGINSHRMFVRGKRVDTQYEAEKTHVTSEAVRIEPLLTAPIAAIPLLVIVLIGFVIYDRHRTGDE